MRQRLRDEVYSRDDQKCQFCGSAKDASDLTIDHLIPMAKGGLDEPINYVTCCLDCNQKKADLPLAEFAASIDLPIEDLPIHGDPVIDNPDVPVVLRQIRKRIVDRARRGHMNLGGTSAQKKIEKAYRRAYWKTEEGQRLEQDFPRLPGHARIMIAEIQHIASSERDFVLLAELSKSAKTRNLIGTVLDGSVDLEKVVSNMALRSSDPSLQKRLRSTWKRYVSELEKRNLPAPRYAV